MNGKTAIISQIGENQLQEETNQKKTFSQDIFNINYVNTSKIYLQPTSHSSDVKVNNYLCYQEGQNLYKVTEIIYEDKLIRIEDKFEVNVDPEKIKSTPIITCVKKEKVCPKNIEKVRIFSKDARKNGKIEKKDKKNIVKNIVKIFISWLEKKQSQKQNSFWEDAIKELQKMLQIENFNNRLIKSIVSNESTSKAFLQFLTDDAEDEIKYSRIQDKQSHYEAIELYISLLSETKGKVKFNSEEYSQSMGDDAFSENDFGGSVDPSRESKSENNLKVTGEKKRNLEGKGQANHSHSHPHTHTHGPNSSDASNSNKNSSNPSTQQSKKSSTDNEQLKTQLYESLKHGGDNENEKVQANA